MGARLAEVARALGPLTAMAAAGAAGWPSRETPRFSAEPAAAAARPYSRVVAKHWTGWPAAALAMLVALALVAGELADAAQRRWWSTHSLTTDTVSGLLVLLVTVLVVNQLLRRRQSRERGQAVAAQATIMVAQAARAARAVSALAHGSGDRDSDSDEFRTYMIMLLVGAPVLIDDPVSRRFLEQAQFLGGVLARTLTTLHGTAHAGASPPDAEFDDAVQRLKDAAAPLLQLLSPEVLSTVEGMAWTADEIG